MSKLQVYYDLNYTLIAIRSQIQDYQIAYFLNKSPFFAFKRMSKDISFIINNTTIYFSTFYDYDNDLKRDSFLIQNKSIYNSESIGYNELFFKKIISNTAFLVPELKQFDYFIKLAGVWKKNDLSKLKECLSRMPIIESETSINLNKIPSAKNLVI
ncbi:MAG: hypothetical protein CMD26_00100 [Flavobacteriales bacterium]|mgnify:FL=1|nr:hypothetical protein [Flavobacteriales bacterium]|tara:strand:+ start:2291 stop:2758 length:468 start_codon:yes stop_codon:yes gene_type:complete